MPEARSASAGEGSSDSSSSGMTGSFPVCGSGVIAAISGGCPSNAGSTRSGGSEPGFGSAERPGIAAAMGVGALVGWLAATGLAAGSAGAAGALTVFVPMRPSSGAASRVSGVGATGGKPSRAGSTRRGATPLLACCVAVPLFAGAGDFSAAGAAGTAVFSGGFVGGSTRCEGLAAGVGGGGADGRISCVRSGVASGAGVSRGTSRFAVAGFSASLGSLSSDLASTTGAASTGLASADERGAGVGGFSTGFSTALAGGRPSSTGSTRKGAGACASASMA